MSWASKPPGFFSLIFLCGLCWPNTSLQARESQPEAEQQDTDEIERARTLAVQGIEFLERERWEEAHARLSEAYALYQAPTVAVLDARALERMGRLTAAYERYRQAADMPVDEASPKPFRQAVRQAQRESDRLLPTIPTLAIEVRQAKASHSLQVNGHLLPKQQWGEPQRVDPGTYTVVALDGARVQASEQVNVETGSRARLVLSLKQPVLAAVAAAEPPPPPPRSQALTWTSLGIGSAGIATGVIAGALMLSAKSDLDSRCSPSCPEESRDLLKRFRTARAVSIAGYSAGVVGLSIGVWLLLDEPASLAPVDGSVAFSREGGELELRGTF